MNEQQIQAYQDSSQFLLDILQCVEQNQGSAEPVYQFLVANLAKLNDDLLNAVLTMSSRLIIDKSKTDSAYIAFVISVFGDLIQQFPLGQQAINMELAIAAYQQALQVTTREAMPLEWATSMMSLANAYSSRIREDRTQNIEDAIEAYQQSLQVITREAMPLEWAKLMGNLAVAYSRRIRGDQAQNIEDAIETYQKSLQVITREALPLEWAQSMNNLATAYYSRIRGDRARNIEKVIKACRQALQMITRETMPALWAQSMYNLANAYRDRIYGDQAQNIEEAIEAYQQSLQVMTRKAMPALWAQSMNSLAVAYSKRIRGDQAQNIEEAIEAYQQSLQVITCEAMPVEWAESMNSLAVAYSKRIRGDRAQNIEEVIEAYQQSLQVITREAMPIGWAKSMNNLANAYRDRIRGDRTQNIEDAIEAYQRSLQVMTCEAMPIEWAQSMNNLAVAYSKRIRGDQAQNIEEAIEAYQQSLQVRTRKAMPLEWAQSMNNLANAYRNRIRGDQAQNVEDAIEAYQKSLQVTTRKAMPLEWAQSMYNLATAYADCIRDDFAQNTKNAIEACKQALEIFQPQLLPNDCRRTARLLGSLYADQQCWNEASLAYVIAVEATEILYSSALSRFGQEAELLETDDLFLRAAFVQAKMGQPDKAVATLEQGRARGLSEALERDRADLTALETAYPDAYHQYRQAADAVRELEVDERSLSSPNQDDQRPISETELMERAEGVRRGLQDAIATIRLCSGYENFLNQPDFSSVSIVVVPGQPIVYLAPTANGSLGLIAYQPLDTSSVEVTPVWLDDLTDTILRGLLNGKGDELGGWFGAYNQRSNNRVAWLQAIDEVTHQLWDLLMGPVVAQLEALQVSQAVLIPTSYLSFLPLHAAWTEDLTMPTGRRYALDTVTFTYAPNARSLQTARAVSKDTAANSLLAINEPRPTIANQLPSSERELEAAIDYFPRSYLVLKHEQATREAVLAELPNNNVLHFSCHGYVNFVNPLDSGLLMANNEVLSLRDFFNTDMQGVRIAILSACETGLPGTKLPDEMVSLPTGLLQAGVAGVAASLWSVADLSTMLLISKFYEFWRDRKLSPDEALRQAQIWLRGSTEREIAPLLGQRTRTPDRCPFEHPFYWAAFSYIGT